MQFPRCASAMCALSGVFTSKAEGLAMPAGLTIKANARFGDFESMYCNAGFGYMQDYRVEAWTAKMLPNLILNRACTNIILANVRTPASAVRPTPPIRSLASQMWAGHMIFKKKKRHHEKSGTGCHSIGISTSLKCYNPLRPNLLA